MILNKENKEKIIERLDIARRNKGYTFEKVGELFGITQAGANNAFRRKSINEHKVNLLIAELEINEKWLLTGNGEMFLTEEEVIAKKKSAFAIPDNYQIIEDLDHKVIKEPNQRYGVKGVPFFDVEFKAGFDLATLDHKTNPEYMIYDPIYAGCDAVIPAFGNSMIPKVYSGDRLGVKLATIDDVLYGEIYALLTEDWRTIKYIRKSKDDSKVVLVPENKNDFDEQELKKSKIQKIFLVKVISRENC